MLCNNCGKNEAIIKMKKIVENKTELIHLCNECAEVLEKELFSDIEDTLTKSIYNFWSALFNAPTQKNVEDNSVACERCHMTLGELSKSNLLGCSDCYKTFNANLVPVFTRTQGKIEHAGKIPVRGGADIAVKKKVDSLRIELEQSIELEDFEKAVVLRDQIRSMEKE